jgi:hypothetical protein
VIARVLLVAILAVAVPVCWLGARPAAGSFEPRVFGTGVLSVGQVYGGCFSGDGEHFYFFRKVSDGEQYRIQVSTRTSSGWGAPARLDLGGDHSDLYPAISRDGTRLIFSSYRPIPGTVQAASRAQLWSAERREDGTWGAPVFLAAVNAPGHYHSWVALDREGHLYYRQTSPDWRTSVTMRATWNGRAYTSSAPYEPVQRWQAWRSDVRVVGGVPTPDGETVFLDVATRDVATGKAASDIWISQRRGDTWSLPEPAKGGVNSDGYDVFPFVSPDGRDLYFVRDFSAFYTVPLADATAPSAETSPIRYVANAAAPHRGPVLSG